MIIRKGGVVTVGATVIHFILSQLDRAADHIGIIISVITRLGNFDFCPKNASVT